MELMTLKLLFIGGVLAMAVVIVLLVAAIQRFAEWGKSWRSRTLTGATGREPARGCDHALGRGRAGWRTLL